MFTKNIVVQMSKCPKVTNFLLWRNIFDFHSYLLISVNDFNTVKDCVKYKWPYRFLTHPNDSNGNVLKTFRRFRGEWMILIGE